MSATPQRAFLVSHTHWDREWYLTFPRFRVQLVETVDAVLDLLEQDTTFTHFCLDGQTLALADYLEARPGQADRVRALVESGRLAVGPWHVLADEVLVSGEATVRNLQFGHAMAARFGGVQKVGYLPDTFGHVAQMPQILRQAGIDSFLYWRGHGDEVDRLGLEWWWEAPDGSRVLAVNEVDGYANAAALGHGELWHAHTRRALDPAVAVAKVRDLFARMAARSRTATWLLSNGCDHHPPQRDFARMLAALRDAFPATTFTPGSLADFLAALRRDLPPDLPAWRGELLGGKDAPILSGVWSARMPLKQANARCQGLLAHEVEPFLAYAHFIHGQPARAGLADLAWRKLVENHPHDSICGCSIDAVHRAMATRFAEVRDTGEHLLSRTLASLAPAFGPTAGDDRDTLILVANPLPWRRSEVVDRLVILQPLGYDLDDLQLLGPGGKPVPFVVKSRRFLQRFWGIDYRGELRAGDQRALLQTYLDTFADRILKTEADRDADLVDCFLEIQFLARDLPACGHAVFRLTDRGPSRERADLRTGELVRADGPVLENGRLRVTLHRDGRVDLVDKYSGLAFSGLNRLEDTEDAGDEYDYSPCQESRTVVADGAAGTVATVEDTGLAATLQVGFDLALPRSLAADRRARSAETATSAVTISVRLTAGGDTVQVLTRFENRAEDHRLRVAFPTGLRTETLVSDGHFLVVERPLQPPRGRDWTQPHPGTYPQQDWSLLADGGGRGLAVIADGLPEVAPRRERDGSATLLLTLLRCVGWLSRDDLPTRRCANAGPTLATPDAQCRGAHEFRYALAPLEAGIGELRRRAWGFLSPPLTSQGVAAGAAIGGSLLAVANPAVAVSAVRVHPRRSTLVVRLWNQSARPQREILTLGLPAERAWLLDLLEDRQEELAIPRAPAREVAIDLLPHRIVTVEIAFAGHDPRDGE
ncbi:MAG TPA: glycoside hydrolase family 38 C-terminal domain-containing protein [Candidatus Krumholzibacteria bacterium]|nr:glycoside hydrolase family 38 C-terminal domain-containing protein [Candidatus Krumholzibacteria bacterium]HPD73226.1 glycoside hydrolase family 38 C-terminal domain-containing protein [Candidatus Krumholzibacteria bacterium]HRY40188.1 glycoside hydrolase family 38 C-terminal domain-containing protein [Candidatus Krumholzibacteria bacterium]